MSPMFGPLRMVIRGRETPAIDTVGRLQGNAEGPCTLVLLNLMSNQMSRSILPPRQKR